MQTDAEVAAIAAGLTKAQRAMLASARETPLISRMKCDGKSKIMRLLGLTVKAWRGGDLLTHLGERVAQHLKQENTK